LNWQPSGVSTPTHKIFGTVGHDNLQLSDAGTARQVEVDSELARMVGVHAVPAIMVRYGDGELVWPGGAPRGGGLEYDELSRIVEDANG
jgi:hypothetical protein